MHSRYTDDYNEFGAYAAATLLMFVAILVLVAMTFIEHRAKGRIAGVRSQSYTQTWYRRVGGPDRIRRIGGNNSLRRHSGFCRPPAPRKVCDMSIQVIGATKRCGDFASTRRCVDRDPRRLADPLLGPSGSGKNRRCCGPSRASTPSTRAPW